MELKFSLDTIKEIATRFWKMTGDTKVFAFHGEMGTGKTTFIHALCESKGVKDAVTSPTFSIINEYSYTEDGIDRKIFHLDLYRLKNEEEAIRAGMEDCLYSDNICLVEWPDRALGIFPPGTLHIYIEIVDSASRKLRTDDKIS
ncbi:MAG TPA: tRNA (adenosine(37)-N6)-threonylcarbamoyltransferase complex ATPase subunit type 1 TsaE [Chitinophagaceae bacterium]|nr:tRNA (adenosine(37)-N6)-threonylcarbamoyltransferase complex ATPase subunit type 1 TsaE [Chitinophagaceae bacterium]